MACEIIKNIEINIRILILLFFRRTENSEIKVVATYLKAIKTGAWRAQYEGKIRNKINLKLIQFSGTKIDEAGSKIENKLFIIFKLSFWFEGFCWEFQ